MTTRLRVFPGVRLAAASVLMLLAGCAAPRTGYLSHPAPGASRGLTLHVTNRSWSDVVVYAADGAVPSRLGRVPALRSAVLVVRPAGRSGGPLRLLVREGGSARLHPLEPVWAGPGRIVEVTVQPAIGTTDLSVR